MALRKISEMCAVHAVPGRKLRQPLPTAKPGHSRTTLLQLLETALHASPELIKFARSIIRDVPSCQIVGSSKPTKGIKRVLQSTFAVLEPGAFLKLTGCGDARACAQRHKRSTKATTRASLTTRA